MPELFALTPQEVEMLARRRRGKPKADLTAYNALLDAMPLEEWSGVLLDTDVTNRTQKQRLNMLAKSRGLRLIYRPGPSAQELYAKLTAVPKRVYPPRNPNGKAASASVTLPEPVGAARW